MARYIWWFKVLFVVFVIYSLVHLQRQLDIANRKLTCQYGLTQGFSDGCDRDYIFSNN